VDEAATCTDLLHPFADDARGLPGRDEIHPARSMARNSGRHIRAAENRRLPVEWEDVESGIWVTRHGGPVIRKSATQCVARKCHDRCAALEFPHLQRPVCRGGDGALAVRRHGHSVDRQTLFRCRACGRSLLGRSVQRSHLLVLHHEVEHVRKQPRVVETSYSRLAVDDPESLDAATVYARARKAIDQAVKMPPQG
jgi:hypothetical protein